MEYKIGRFGKVFMRINGEWLASDKTKAELEHEIKKQARAAARLAQSKKKQSLRVLARRHLLDTDTNSK